MSGIIKVLLIGVGGLVFLAVLAIVGIGMIFTDDYNQIIDGKVAEGREFGKTTVKQGCLDKSRGGQTEFTII